MTYGYKKLDDGSFVPYPIDTQLPKKLMDCPNCVTPWKCNGPHIIQSSSEHYSSNDGIFIKEFDEWKFIPNEKSFNSNYLLDIVNTLNILNDRLTKHKRDVNYE